MKTVPHVVYQGIAAAEIAAACAELGAVVGAGSWSSGTAPGFPLPFAAFSLYCWGAAVDRSGAELWVALLITSATSCLS